MNKIIWLISVIASLWAGSQWSLIKGHLMAHNSTDGVSLSESLEASESENTNYESINFNGYELLHLSSNKSNTLFVSKDNFLMTLGKDNLYIGSHKALGGCSINTNSSSQHLNYDFVDSNNNIIGNVYDFGRDGVADSRVNFKTDSIEISIDNQWFNVAKGIEKSAINTKGEVQSYKKDGNRYSWQ